MKQYYESEVLFQLMERDGLNIPSSVPPYEADIKAYLINQVKQAYPKLTDYEAEWLLYNYTKHLPAEFPISSVSDVTEATFENVVPFAYQSAILKGNTLVNINRPVTKNNNMRVENGLQILTTWSTAYNIWMVNDITLFKTNTKYYIIVEVVNNTLTSEWSPMVGSNDCVFLGNISSLNFASKETGIKCATFTTKSDFTNVICGLRSATGGNETVGSILEFKIAIIEYQDGMENWDISFLTGMQSVTMPVLTTSNEDGTKTNILSCLEPVELGSVGEVKDELNLLTQQLTQRTETRPYQEGDELNSEFVTDMTNTRYKLAQEVIKTVDLTTVNEKGETTYFIPLEGTMNAQSSGEIIQPTFDMTVPVEATTQNLASFIELEMRNNHE